MNTISTKSLNRLRKQIGNSRLGVLPDVGNPNTTPGHSTAFAFGNQKSFEESTT